MQPRLPGELWAKHVLPHLPLRDIGTILLVHKELRYNASIALHDVRMILTMVCKFQTSTALLLETAADIRRLREDVDEANAAFDDVMEHSCPSLRPPLINLAHTFRAADLLQEQTARQQRLINKKRKLVRLLDSRLQEYFDWYSANIAANLRTGNRSGLPADRDAHTLHMMNLQAEGML